MWNASICEELLHRLTQTASSPERSACLEVRIPATLRSAFAPPERGLFFWLLPNPYFLSEPDSNHGCASMCRTKREIPVVSPKASWLSHKRNKSDALVPSLKSPRANLFVGSRSLAILNSGSGSGGERRSLREKSVSIKDACRPLHTQGDQGFQGHQAEQPYLGGCFKSLGKGSSSSWFSLQQKWSLAGQWVQILIQ